MDEGSKLHNESQQQAQIEALVVAQVGVQVEAQ